MLKTKNIRIKRGQIESQEKRRGRTLSYGRSSIDTILDGDEQGEDLGQESPAEFLDTIGTGPFATDSALKPEPDERSKC